MSRIRETLYVSKISPEARSDAPADIDTQYCILLMQMEWVAQFNNRRNYVSGKVCGPTTAKPLPHLCEHASNATGNTVCVAKLCSSEQCHGVVNIYQVNITYTPGIWGKKQLWDRGFGQNSYIHIYIHSYIHTHTYLSAWLVPLYFLSPSSHSEITQYIVSKHDWLRTFFF